MKVAFIVSGFPILSQTFILNQITGLLDLGHDVQIFARINPNEPKIHPDVDKYHLIERTHYMPQIPKNLIKRRLKAIYLIITNFHKSPLKILKSLNIPKYRKDTLSLIYTLIPFLDKKFDIIQCHFGSCGNLGSYLIHIGVQGKLVTMFHGYDVRLGIKEGERVLLRVAGTTVILESLQDPIRLALSGKKFASIKPEQVEAISLEQQTSHAECSP